MGIVVPAWFLLEHIADIVLILHRGGGAAGQHAQSSEAEQDVRSADHGRILPGRPLRREWVRAPCGAPISYSRQDFNRIQAMLWQALSAARDIGRVQDIASVLIRYGFGDVVQRVGMAGALERAGKVLHWKEGEELAQLKPPARLRRVLEELGPTFVKLGQVLATRVDLFGPEWLAELSKLQDHAPPCHGIRSKRS